MKRDLWRKILYLLHLDILHKTNLQSESSTDLHGEIRAKRLLKKTLKTAIFSSVISWSYIQIISKVFIYQEKICFKLILKFSFQNSL